MKERGVILFHTTAGVMRAEKLLLGQRFTIKLIPPPRQFSSDCGISVQFQWEDKDRIVEALRAADVKYEAVYKLP
jgi:hypothetical protein